MAGVGLSPGTLRLATARRVERPDPAAELLDLQRQYKIIEGDRKQYLDKTQAVLKRQEQSIQELEENNDNLRMQIRMLQSQLAHTQQSPWNDKVGTLTQTIASFNKKIDQEKATLEHTERDIKALDTRISEHQSAIGGSQAGTASDIQAQKMIKTYENRLEKAQTKYNDVLASNKTQRDQIDHMKRERAVFETIFKRLEKDISERKKRMAELIEESNYAYEARDDTQNKMVSMRDRTIKEIADHEAEVRELDRMIEQESRRTSTSGKLEFGLDQGDGSPAKLDASSPLFRRPPTQNTSQPTVDDKKKKSGAGGGAGSVSASDEEDASSEMTALTSFMSSNDQALQDTFKKALAAWDLDPNTIALEDFVTRFINGEYQNFSLFNFVNELNNDSEKMDEENAQLRLELAKLEGPDASGSTMRALLLSSLSSRLASATSKALKYDKKTALTLKLITALRTPILTLHHKIGCDALASSTVTSNGQHDSGALQKSGNLQQQGLPSGPHAVNEANVLDYLGDIEEKADQIIKVVLELDKTSHSQDDEDSTKENGQSVNGGSGQLLPGLTHQNLTTLLAKCPPLAIDPPTAGEDYDEDAEDESGLHPLSREELRERAKGGPKKTKKDKKPKRKIDVGRLLSAGRRR